VVVLAWLIVRVELVALVMDFPVVLAPTVVGFEARLATV
jgi:hypothetical protein